VVQRAFPLLSLIAIIMTWAIGWIHLRGDIVSRPKRSLSFTSIFLLGWSFHLAEASASGVSCGDAPTRRKYSQAFCKTSYWCEETLPVSNAVSVEEYLSSNETVKECVSIYTLGLAGKGKRTGKTAICHFIRRESGQFDGDGCGLQSPKKLPKTLS
jgi:hypothetical protein